MPSKSQPEMVQLNRPNFIHYTMLNVPARHRSGTSSQSEASTPYFDDFLGEVHEVLSSDLTPHNDPSCLDVDLTFRERFSRDQIYGSGYESDQDNSSIPSTLAVRSVQTPHTVSTSTDAQDQCFTPPPSVPVSHRNSRFWPSLPTTGLASTHFSNLTIQTAPTSIRDACVRNDQRALHLLPTTPLVTSSNANVKPRSSNRDSSLSYAQYDHGGFGGLRIINEVDEEDTWGMAMTPTLDDYEFTFKQEETESVFSFDWRRPVGQVYRNMGVWLGRKVGRVFGRR
jgi:hypothetical protein